MSKLTVVTREGDEMVIAEARPGASVMELMRENDVPELLALCGGARSCATCHVWVDPAFQAKLSGAGEEETELLDSSMYRKPNSRLSCQIKWTHELDGLRVTLAPED
jgi:ferredoxin, 2Fe-2S